MNKQNYLKHLILSNYDTCIVSFLSIFDLDPTCRSLDHADIFAAAICCTDTRIVPTPEAKHFPQICRYR